MVIEDKNDWIASRLRISRRASWLSIEQLASAVGRSSKTISRWEGAKGSPDVNDLTKLAAALGVTPHWLMTGEGTKDLIAAFQGIHSELNPDGSTTNLFPVEETGPRLTPSQKILQNVMLDLDASKLSDDEAARLTLAIQEALRRARP